MKWLLVVVVCFGMFFLNSCKEKNVLYTKSGTKIELLDSKIGGKTLVDSTILLLKMTYARENGDVLWSTPGNRTLAIPIYFAQWEISGKLYEALSYLKVGDSAKFIIEARDLYENSLRTSVPDSIRDEEQMLITVKYDTLMTALEFRHMREREIHLGNNKESNKSKEREELM